MRVDMKEMLAFLETLKDGAAFAAKMKELDAKEQAVMEKLRIADSVDKVLEMERKVEARASALEARAFALEEAAKKREKEYREAYEARLAELEARVAIERSKYSEGRGAKAMAEEKIAEAETALKKSVEKENELAAREVALAKAIKQLNSKVFRIYQIMGEE